MAHHEKEKFIEFKRVDEFKFPKFNYLIVGIILAIIIVGWYGFITINNQLSELTDKIEEVKIEETTLPHQEEDTTSSTDIPKAEDKATSAKIEDDSKSILGFWNDLSDDEKEETVAAKKAIKDKINCKDYIKLISVVVSLKQKLDFGESFQREIVLLAVAAKNDKNLAKYIEILDGYSESGVPNKDSLASEFQSIENDIVIASRLSEEGINWKYKLLKLASKFIFVKKIGDRALRGGGIDMIVQKVNNYLIDEDLVKAIDELKKVDNENVKNIASIWISHANDYLNAHKVANQMYRYVFNNLNCEFKEVTNKTENENNDKK